MSEELSSFNPDTFVNVEYEEAIDTTITPIPVGEWSASSNIIKFRKINTKDGERTVMDVTWELLEEEVRKATGLDHPTCRQTIFLDINDANGIDMSKGKNRQLGLLREALGQNVAGQRWSPGMIEGQMATVTVVHNADREDPEIIYSNIKKVTKA